jgi:hypothetical protein
MRQVDALRKAECATLGGNKKASRFAADTKGAGGNKKGEADTGPAGRHSIA